MLYLFPNVLLLVKNAILAKLWSENSCCLLSNYSLVSKIIENPLETSEKLEKLVQIPNHSTAEKFASQMVQNSKKGVKICRPSFNNKFSEFLETMSFDWHANSSFQASKPS
jgi:hypothetical protein